MFSLTFVHIAESKKNKQKTLVPSINSIADTAQHRPFFQFLLTCALLFLSFCYHNSDAFSLGMHIINLYIIFRIPLVAFSSEINSLRHHIIYSTLSSFHSFAGNVCPLGRTAPPFRSIRFVSFFHWNLRHMLKLCVILIILSLVGIEPIITIRIQSKMSSRQ